MAVQNKEFECDDIYYRVDELGGLTLFGSLSTVWMFAISQSNEILKNDTPLIEDLALVGAGLCAVFTLGCLAVRTYNAHRLEKCEYELTSLFHQMDRERTGSSRIPINLGSGSDPNSGRSLIANAQLSKTPPI